MEVVLTPGADYLGHWQHFDCLVQMYVLASTLISVGVPELCLLELKLTVLPTVSIRCSVDVATKSVEVGGRRLKLVPAVATRPSPSHRASRHMTATAA